MRFQKDPKFLFLQTVHSPLFFREIVEIPRVSPSIAAILIFKCTEGAGVRSLFQAFRQCRAVRSKESDEKQRGTGERGAGSFFDLDGLIKKQVTTVAWDGQIDVTSRKKRVTFYRRPSGTVCFRRVSRREDNGETDKSSCILIVTFLLKLSSQWVKYALACVYIDLPIGEMKKKSENVCVHS